eukprot:TRINITY_DN585_c0_g3_i3.p1 TRINITY_DN585_c0_g3~~TRINITY_DN585_c0_g3_i3.p1  ORF type:complete len:214 (+),score=64.62 TRINITY_DN585_c0_g3_i3:33-644(+)
MGVEQRFGSAGQRCTAPKRIFLHHKVYDAFKEQVVAATLKLKVGDPTLEETDVGPVINETAANTVWRRTNDAVNRGAVALTPLRREGNVIWPTVLENLPEGCELVADETFGPIMPLLKFESTDQMVEQVNSTPFGLQAGLFTESIATAKSLFERLDVGALAINAGPGFRTDTMPFGGVKNSGMGREGVAFAMQEMQYTKTLIL